MKTAICLGVAAALTLASAAMAEGPDRPGRGERADANGDGRVTLEESQIALKARMMRLDTDRDGRVTQAEMEAVRAQHAERRGMRERGAGRFAELDADHNGQLSQGEFDAGREQFAERRREGRQGHRSGMARHRGEPAEHFARLDANHDGAVSPAELDQAAAARFSQMDANHDGALTADERPDRGHRGPHR
jgi:Ca2+-binding EF-hand superfamily protein